MALFGTEFGTSERTYKLVEEYVSIQICPTYNDGEDVERVSVGDERATHWSVYLRNREGLVTWQKDFSCEEYDDMAKNLAILYAAKLSRTHFIPIEAIV